VNLIGKSEDSSLYNILSALPKQLPHIEEFLSRPDKSSQEIKMFLEKHYQEIHAELIKYLKNKASETLEKSKEYDKEHSEL
jgi:tRNA A22 N-methylase